MCGIVGFVDKHGALSHSERERVLADMIASIEHRGRDGTGGFIDGTVAIGNVRLSILDVSEAAAQPFIDASGCYVLSYNGEIYNYRTLRDSLKTHTFCSSSDTETVLYAYIDDPQSYLDRLKGMFAYSLYDKNRHILTLAVDRFSIKPLYYVDTPEWFAWSSEIKAFRKLPRFTIELAHEYLSEFVQFRQVAGQHTLVREVKRVLPAEELTFDCASGTLRTRRYWQLAAEKHTGSDDQQTVRELLENSVDEHLVSDVPVGLQLSGGVDSSLVAALAARRKPGLHTYSIGLADEAWNEFRYSRMVAKDLGTVHHELLFTEDDMVSELPLLAFMHDEPIAHSHSVPMYLLAKRARQDVKVLLSGEGADEVFLGYKRYTPLLARKCSEREIVFSSAFVSAIDAAHIVRGFDSGDAPLAYRFGVLQGADEDPARRVSYYDLMTYLPPLLLRQDKMGMAANLENRVPFLDHALVQYGYSLPMERKISGRESKIILKEVATGFLPRDLVYRKKCGFGQPISEWLRHPEGLGRYLGLFEEGTAPESIDYGVLRAAADEHTKGTKEHTEVLWTMLNFELWMRVFVRGEKSADIARAHI